MILALSSHASNLKKNNKIRLRIRKLKKKDFLLKKNVIVGQYKKMRVG